MKSLLMCGAAFGLYLALAPVPVAPGQDRSTAERWEFRAVALGTDEKEATRRLNELAADGWHYVGPLGNNLVAFKRPALTPEERAVRTELDKLQGTWALVSYESGGRQVRGEDRRCSWTLQGDRWVGKWAKDDGGEQIETGTLKIVKLDDTGHRVDLLHTEGPYKGSTTPALMRVEGNTMKYCWGENRPAEFTTREGDGRGLSIFRRVKP